MVGSPSTLALYMILLVKHCPFREQSPSFLQLQVVVLLVGLPFNSFWLCPFMLGIVHYLIFILFLLKIIWNTLFAGKCLFNIAEILKLLKGKPTNKTSICNCRKPGDYLLNGQCLTNNTIYKAEVEGLHAMNNISLTKYIFKK